MRDVGIVTVIDAFPSTFCVFIYSKSLFIAFLYD